MFLNLDGTQPRRRRLQETAAEIKTRVSDLKIFALITAGSH
jgi:hypothetical protein